jgi:hypothetical protein
MADDGLTHEQWLAMRREREQRYAESWVAMQLADARAREKRDEALTEAFVTLVYGGD